MPNSPRGPEGREFPIRIRLGQLINGTEAGDQHQKTSKCYTVLDAPRVKVFSESRGQEVDATVTHIATDGKTCRVMYGSSHKWIVVAKVKPALLVNIPSAEPADKAAEGDGLSVGEKISLADNPLATFLVGKSDIGGCDHIYELTSKRTVRVHSNSRGAEVSALVTHVTPSGDKCRVEYPTGGFKWVPPHTLQPVPKFMLPHVSKTMANSPLQSPGRIPVSTLQTVKGASENAKGKMTKMLWIGGTAVLLTIAAGTVVSIKGCLGQKNGADNQPADARRVEIPRK